MKKILQTMTFGLVLTFMFTTLGFAQYQIQIAESHKGDVTPNKEDVLLPGNWESATTVTLYNWIDADENPIGWIFGNNQQGDNGVAQQFDVTEEYEIVGAYFWVGAATDATDDVHFTIWEFDGGSFGDVLATKTFALSDITPTDWDLEPGPGEYVDHAFYVEFDTPVLVSSNYAIGVDLSDVTWSAHGDGLGMATTLAGEGGALGKAFIRREGTWSVSTDINAALDMDIGIFPVTASGAGETYSVTFNVDMTDAVAEGDVAFDPAIHNVYVSGTFANDWAEPGSDETFKLEPVTTREETVIYEEHFNPANDTGEMPSDWVQKKADNAIGDDLVDLEETDTRWWRYSELFDMGYGEFYPEWIHTEDASMHINWNVEAEGNVYAITPSMILNPADEMTLEFWMYFSSDYHTELNVLLELDGTWEVLAEYNSTDHENLYDSAIELDLTDKVGEARIAFVYKWTDGIQMNIDAIKVYGLNVTTPDQLIYTVTLPVSEGDHEYKYFLTEDAPSWDLGEWAGGDDNRTLTVEGDMTKDDVFGVPDDTFVNSISQDGFKVYPNPARDIMNINSDSQINELRVFDLSGKLVFSQSYNAKEAVINVQTFNEGLYIMQIATDNGIENVKFSVLK